MDVTARHLAIPQGFRMRAPSNQDAGAVAELKRSVEIARHGDSDVTLDLVHEEWALPRLDLHEDAWLIEDERGRLAGYGLCWMEAPPGEIVADQTVDPALRGRGLSEVLLDAAEARAARLLRSAAPRGDGTLGVWAHESDVPRVRLYERRGYTRVRTFLRLGRDLQSPVEEPLWPAGVSSSGFRRGRDEATVHAATEEAFRDHFRPTAMTLEEWLQFRFSRDDLDLGLWFVARQDDEVVGGVLAFETPLGGYVDELFVRRPWRGRGVGRALLLTACRELRRRGLPLAYLGVDSENPTGAMHLYGSAGFTSTRGATHVFEKTIVAG
jgi:mycothiol synthase